MPVTEQLRVRRALAKAAGQRQLRKRRKLPRLREPRGLRLRYQRALTAQRKAIEKLLREQLYPQLPAILAQAEQERGGFRQDTARDVLVAILTSLGLELFENRFPPELLERDLSDLADDVDRFQRNEFRKQMAGALNLPLIIQEPFLATLKESFVKDNIKLVGSLQGQQLDELEELISGGIRRGLRVEDTQAEIQARLDVSKSRASLIARDQVGKLFGEMTQLRQQNVGISEYTWSTSGDERVRPGHAVLEGTVQSWSKPPIVDVSKKGVTRKAHPGGDFQCRCQAIPVLPEALLAEIAK